MRENTIPPMRRLSRITEAGRLAVDVSANWMQEIYDYEELGSIELFAALKKKDTPIKPGEDEEGLFCKVCDSEVGEDDVYCWWCGQALKRQPKGEQKNE